MPTYTIPRSGDAPLKFDGELIATAGSDQFASRELQRWHTLSLYRTDSRWIVHVAFRSRWRGESSRDDAYVCDSTEGVRAVLREHEPVGERVGFPPGDQYATRQRTLETEITEQYDHAVSEILARDEFTVSVDSVQSEQYAALDLQAVDSFVRQILSGFPLTRAEVCAFCDANNGAMFCENSWHGMAANVFDGDRLNGLGEKWEIDAKALADRIHRADVSTKFALAFACCQFWRMSNEDTDAAIAAAGFEVLE